VQYLAHPIKTGKARADIDVTVLNKNLEAKNRILLRRMDFGPKVKDPSPEAQDLPLDLALPVLKDPSGNINLNIPVQGRIDDPQFRLTETIFSSVMGLFVKAAFSPFSLLGTVFAGSPEESGVFTFAPGRAILSPQELDRLDTISQALNKRPKLDVEIVGYADPESDADALHETLFQRAVKKQKWLDMGGEAPADLDSVSLTPEEYAEYLEDAYKEAPFEKPENVFGAVQTQPVEVMEQALREHLAPAPQDLQKLAADRARNVRQRLVERGKVASSRLFLSTGSPGAGGKGEKRRKVVLILQ
jgi:outer membrane protein OmpA-like peptidoglycan-associated protein